MILNVITFNIRCCNDPDGHSIEERAPRLADAVLGLDPDVIGFQECVSKWEPLLDAHFGDRYDIYCQHRDLNGSESSPLLWKKDKFDLVRNGTFWLSDTPAVVSRGWDEKYHCYRICSWVVLQEKASGQRFTFMNTHFGFGDEGQCASADLIGTYAKAIDDLPTFVTGDFNLRPDSPGYAQMTKYFTDANVERDLRPTYHGYHPAEIDDYHIDYCFVNDKVKPLSQTRIENTYDGKFPSDHYGLNIRLEL